MLNKIGEKWDSLLIEAKTYLLQRKVVKRLKSYSSAEEHVLAGDIIIEKKVKDEVLKTAAVQLNHRVHRLYAFLGMFDTDKQAPPKVIVDKELELIGKSIEQIRQRTEAKRGLE